MRSIPSIPVAANIGLATFTIVGVCACVLLALTILWALVQVAFIILASLEEVATAITSLYSSSDSLVKLLILVSIGYTLYRFFQTRKGRVL